MSLVGIIHVEIPAFVMCFAAPDIPGAVDKFWSGGQLKINSEQSNSVKTAMQKKFQLIQGPPGNDVSNTRTHTHTRTHARTHTHTHRHTHTHKAKSS